VICAGWFAVMLVLPLLIVFWFIGIGRSPAWGRGRFSLRALMIIMTLFAVVFGVVVCVAEFFDPAR
jgi:hypothetical protein